MRITVEMEIESADYGGREFQEEIESLIKNIDDEAELKAFKMQVKDDPHPEFDERSLDWRED
jgi:hypothetical protein